MRRLLPLLLTGLLSAQPAPDRLRFDVASIKLLDATLGDLLRTEHRSITITDSRVVLKGQTLVELIARAWDVRGDQVTGIPGSISNQFFDVEAEIPSGVSRDSVPVMLQALLRERFNLLAHTSEQVRPVYIMTAGKGALKLQPSGGEGPGKCTVEGLHRMCRAMTMKEFAATLTGIGQIGRAAANAPGPAAAAIMEWIIDRPVEDQTNLEGRYDFLFDYNRVGAGGPDAPPLRVIDAVTGLGLKLDTVKRSLTTVNIDRVDKLPTGN